MCGFKSKQNENRPESGGTKGKNMKSISAILCALALLGSMAVVRAEQTCCEKAKAAGKECDHKCCVKAKKEGKVCEKCNPPKKDEKPK
jgi:hypothetical protein